MSTWSLINRDDLQHAATTAAFATLLPVLLRRLIAETSVGITHLDMPGWGGVAMPGFDGIVKATESSPFVPEGVSIWEVSISGGNAKANEDYEKRELAPEGLSTREVTYIQVLLEPWAKMREWQEERNNDGRWRAVRAYNLDMINVWLESAPATEIWLADRLGKPHAGVRSLETWWQDEWKPSTWIPLDERFVLAGRTEQADSLREGLSSKKQFIFLGGSLRVEEMQAFVAATIASTPELKRLELWAQTVIISDTTALKWIMAYHESLIIVLEDPLLARGLSPGIHCLVATAPAGSSGDIKVPRIDDQHVINLLQEQGKTLSEASRLGILGRRSFLAMRREIAREPNVHTPTWAFQSDPLMRKLLLFGSWNEMLSADVNLVERYTYRTYDDLQNKLENFEQADDIPFLGTVAGIKYIVAPQDAWTLLENNLTGSDFDHFANFAHEVLAEAQSYTEETVATGQSLELYRPSQFSHEIRKGVAETLAIMGSREIIVESRSQTTQTIAHRIVRTIFEAVASGESSRGWASLTDVLLRLAEAAPKEFLDAIRTVVANNPSPQIVPFADDQGGLFGTTHTSTLSAVLAALSMLAWSPDFIDEATGLTALLAEYEWERIGTNQAYEALVTTLNIVAPQTSASLDDRIRCVETIVNSRPRVGSRLLATLLPDHYTIMVPPKPIYREWADSVGSTRSDLERGAGAFVELLISNYGQEVGPLTAAVENIEMFPPPHSKKLVRHLSDIADSLSEPTRTTIYESLREKLVTHASALDSGVEGDTLLQRLQRLRDEFAPQTPIHKYGWLYREAYPPLEGARCIDDYDEFEILLDSKRVTSLKEILAEDGISGVLKLAELSWSAGSVGSLLAEISAEYDDLMLSWLGGRRQTAMNVASGYLDQRFQQSHDSLAQSLLLKAEEPRIKARIISLIGVYQTEQMHLSSLDEDVREAYWSEFRYFGRGSQFPYVVEAAQAMMEVGRPIEALDMLALYIDKDQLGLDAAELIITAFEKLLSKQQIESGDPELSQHDYIKLFEFIGPYHESLGLYRLLNLEWQLCPVGGLNTTMPVLHRALVKHPDIFVALVLATMDITMESAQISDIFKPSRQVPSVSSRARSVLFTCKLCPGVEEQGSLDPAVLESWITSARSMFATACCQEQGDLEIGKIVSNAPPTDYGAPLDEPVRDLLEKFANEKIDRGVRSGILNARGVVSQGIYDGGRKDQDMSDRFEQYEKSSRPWPRTRKIFEEIAAIYRSDAYRGDSYSEQLRHGFMF